MDTRKTKIVCSIGPSCDNDETIRSMILEGMNVARFNFSHGTYEWHKQAMDRVKRISKELDIPVAILLDTKGPEIRTGLIDGDNNVIFHTGESVIVTSDDSLCVNAAGDKPCHISISWKEAPHRLKSGHKILIADGLIELSVKDVKGEEIICVCNNDGSIGSRKNVNLIGIHAGLPILSPKDKEDLKFGAGEDIDFVAASFVSFAEEVVEIKKYLKEVGANALVIAKIENEEGLNNIEAIAREADGVMVARGDLGVQLPTERIPLAQKAIISCCRRLGKPVITATQMLDSMINNPRPTRAELTDVSNAVFDGTDAVMLSGETAGGKYPVESVKTMAQITLTTEASQEYISRMRYLDTSYTPGSNIALMVSHSAYKLAKNIKAKAIITPTMHGNSARMIGSFRPEQSVIAITPDAKVQRQLMIHWGVKPFICPMAPDSEAMTQNAIKIALDKGAVHLSDVVLMCAGIPLSNPLMANNIRVLVVGNVIARGNDYGFADVSTKRANGRIIKEELITENTDMIRINKKSILVCWRITEELTPILRVVEGVISETGSDMNSEVLKLINPNLIWILGVPDAQSKFENNLTVTLDGEQGLVYEGTI